MMPAARVRRELRRTSSTQTLCLAYFAVCATNSPAVLWGGLGNKGVRCCPTNCPVRLLTGGALKDAGRNQHTVSAIDDLVIHEPRDWGMMGKSPQSRAAPLRPGRTTLVPPYRCVHRLTPPFYPASLKRINPFHYKQNATS